MASKAHLFFLFPLALILLSISAEANLQVGFYSKTCSNVEDIVRKEMIEILKVAPSLAGPLLRMHFHDCFVRMESKQVIIPAATGVIVTIVSDHLNGKDMMTTHPIPILIAACSLFGIFLFYNSQVLEPDYPVIVAFCELVGILSADLFISSLLSTIVLPDYLWLVYALGLLSFLPLLNKPGKLVYRCLSEKLVSAYRLVIERFNPAGEPGEGIV